MPDRLQPSQATVFREQLHSLAPEGIEKGKFKGWLIVQIKEGKPVLERTYNVFKVLREKISEWRGKCNLLNNTLKEAVALNFLEQNQQFIQPSDFASVERLTQLVGLISNDPNSVQAHKELDSLCKGILNPSFLKEERVISTLESFKENHPELNAYNEKYHNLIQKMQGVSTQTLEQPEPAEPNVNQQDTASKQKEDLKGEDIKSLEEIRSQMPKQPAQGTTRWNWSWKGLALGGGILAGITWRLFGASSGTDPASSPSSPSAPAVPPPTSMPKDTSPPAIPFQTPTPSPSIPTPPPSLHDSPTIASLLGRIEKYSPKAGTQKTSANKPERETPLGRNYTREEVTKELRDGLVIAGGSSLVFYLIFKTLCKKKTINLKTILNEFEKQNVTMLKDDDVIKNLTEEQLEIIDLIKDYRGQVNYLGKTERFARSFRNVFNTFTSDKEKVLIFFSNRSFVYYFFNFLENEGIQLHRITSGLKVEGWTDEDLKIFHSTVAKSESPETAEALEAASAFLFSLLLGRSPEKDQKLDFLEIRKLFFEQEVPQYFPSEFEKLTKEQKDLIDFVFWLGSEGKIEGVTKAKFITDFVDNLKSILQYEKLSKTVFNDPSFNHTLALYLNVAGINIYEIAAKIEVPIWFQERKNATELVFSRISELLWPGESVDLTFKALLIQLHMKALEQGKAFALTDAQQKLLEKILEETEKKSPPDQRDFLINVTKELFSHILADQTKFKNFFISHNKFIQLLIAYLISKGVQAEDIFSGLPLYEEPEAVPPVDKKKQPRSVRQDEPVRRLQFTPKELPETLEEFLAAITPQSKNDAVYMRDAVNKFGAEVLSVLDNKSMIKSDLFYNEEFIDELIKMKGVEILPFLPVDRLRDLNFMRKVSHIVGFEILYALSEGTSRANKAIRASVEALQEELFKENIALEDSWMSFPVEQEVAASPPRSLKPQPIPSRE